MNANISGNSSVRLRNCACLTDLHRAYGGVCAYVGVFFERVMGGGSVDHFVAKSANAGPAYEWNNYRLACSTMNSRKREYSDVLDPFALASDLFRLQLSTGHIYPNPELNAVPMRVAEETIKRLGLDDPQCREMRARWYQDYLEHYLPSAYLKSKAPFVWTEANRQGLLKRKRLYVRLAPVFGIGLQSQTLLKSGGTSEINNDFYLCNHPVLTN